MAIQHVDEVLAKAVSSDSTAIPRYNILDSNGNVLYANAQLVLANTISTAGTPVNKALLDEFLAASGDVAGNALNTTIALSQAGFVLKDGAMIRFRYTGTTVTCVERKLNVNSTGAKYMSNSRGSLEVSLKNGSEYIAIYNSSKSEWILVGIEDDYWIPVGTVLEWPEAPNKKWQLVTRPKIIRTYETSYIYGTTNVLDELFTEKFKEFLIDNKADILKSIGTDGYTYHSLYRLALQPLNVVDGRAFFSDYSTETLTIVDLKNNASIGVADMMEKAVTIDLNALPFYTPTATYKHVTAVCAYGDYYLFLCRGNTTNEIFSVSKTYYMYASSYTRIYHSTTVVADTIVPGTSGVLIFSEGSSTLSKISYYTASVTTTDSWNTAGYASYLASYYGGGYSGYVNVPGTAKFIAIYNSSSSAALFVINCTAATATCAAYELWTSNRYYTSASSYTNGYCLFIDNWHWCDDSTYVYIFGSMSYGESETSTTLSHKVGIWRITLSSTNMHLTTTPYSTVSVPANYPLDWSTAKGPQYNLRDATYETNNPAPGLKCFDSFSGNGSLADIKTVKGLCYIAHSNTTGSTKSYQYYLIDVSITRTTSSVSISVSLVLTAPSVLNVVIPGNTPGSPCLYGYYNMYSSRYLLYTATKVHFTYLSCKGPTSYNLYVKAEE